MKESTGVVTNRTLHNTVPALLNTPEWYSDLTPRQKLVALVYTLMSGKPFSPSAFAGIVGTDRRNIYVYLHDLSQMGVPVVKVRRNHWTLKYFVKDSIHDV